MSQDLPPEAFRRVMHRATDLIADSFASLDQRPVLSAVEPGEVRASLPASPPLQGEELDVILDDYQRLIEPGLTRWNHPGFFAYFAITGSAPGILGETLAAAANVNAMLWRTSPAATELEELTCDWLRQMMGLAEGWHGHINDTASSSTLIALAAARHRAAPEVRQVGLRALDQDLIVYTSDQAHSSVDKAMITLGMGLDNVRHIRSDDAFRMDPKALLEAIRADRAAGKKPIAVMATVGTTSTSSLDPVAEVGRICKAEELFFHVDAAYGGPAMICPEMRSLFEGIESADSIVVNPHKWLFVPIDCSVLFVREPDLLRAAFSLVPEYLRTSFEGVTNLMDFGPQLGRRFRALKLWMVIRAFGSEGLAERIRAHCSLARRFAAKVEAEPGFEVSAPVPLALVCFRGGLGNGDLAAQNEFQHRLLAEVNAVGPIYLSHTDLRGRIVLRLAIGNLHTEAEHVDRAWELIRDVAERLTRESFANPS